MVRTFKKPVDWGLAPGPPFVESIGGALAAVDLWLRHAADDDRRTPAYQLMVDLRQQLAMMPQNPTPCQVQVIMDAISIAVSAARPKGDSRLRGG